MTANPSPAGRLDALRAAATPGPVTEEHRFREFFLPESQERALVALVNALPAITELVRAAETDPTVANLDAALAALDEALR